MKFIKYMPIIISFLLLIAHFSRAGIDALMAFCIFLPLILFYKKPVSVRIIQIALILGAIEWGRTVLSLIEIRQMINIPWLRLAVILGSVALFTFLSALFLQIKAFKKVYNHK